MRRAHTSAAKRDNAVCGGSESSGIVRSTDEVPSGSPSSMTGSPSAGGSGDLVCSTGCNATELAQHSRLSLEADIEICFCDPHSPWRCGTNEDTIRLIRQYFPRGTRLDGYSQATLSRTARELNARPRKTLGFKTSLEIFAEALP